jgi:hypothetical protein
MVNINSFNKTTVSPTSVKMGRTRKRTRTLSSGEVAKETAAAEPPVHVPDAVLGASEEQELLEEKVKDHLLRTQALFSGPPGLLSDLNRCIFGCIKSGYWT